MLHIHTATAEAEPQGLSDFLRTVLPLGDYHAFATSGSEGVPKWVLLSKTALQASAQAVNEHLELKPTDRWFIALPQHHVGGWSIRERAELAGVPWHDWPERWSAQGFATACTQLGITHSSLVPTQVYDLVQAGLPAPESLRAIIVGGGSLALALGQRAQALGWPVLQSYGMTETASQVATEPLDHLYTGFDPTAMELLPHWQAQVDEANRLVLKGRALATGYALQTEPGQWAWQPIGPSFTTRDQVSLWQHGRRQFLRFLGREADTLKILGELVSLQTLQTVLSSITTQATLLAQPDERRGVALLLVHELAPAEAEQVRQCYDAQVRPFERIQTLRHLPQLPRSELGKIRVQELRHLLS
jgi:o-succinylbenzoate---CoA ligase